MKYVQFASWEDVLAFVREHKYAFYHPPLNHAAVRVLADVEGDAVRVTPYDKRADPFTADRGHFDRFRKQEAA